MMRTALAAVVALVAVLVIWRTVKTYEENVALQAPVNAFASERAKYPFILLDKSASGADYADQRMSDARSVAIITVYFEEQHSQEYGPFHATRNVFKYSCIKKYYTLQSSELIDRQGKSLATIPINSTQRFSSQELADHFILDYACNNKSIGPGFKNILRVIQHGRFLAPSSLDAPSP
ncbi:MAG: hypothetical protein ACOVMT_04805 [Caulobacter sp.]